MTNSQPNIVAFPGPHISREPATAGALQKALVIPLNVPGGNAQCTRPDPVYPTSAARDAVPPLNLAELWSAINEKRVRVHYQPQFDFATGRTVAVEALARIVDESGTLIFPARFIGQAERSAMIVPLGRAVINAVCRDLASWRANGMSIERVAVNLSAHQLNVDQSLPEFVAGSLEQCGLTATDLEFELTERRYLDSAGTGMNSVRKLALSGVRIALDDFGVSYSSVAHLSEMPVSTVKFARTMVSRIPEHRTTERVIRHLVALARDVGMTVVAEGIETWDQHDYLATSGCHLGQGFLFAEPMAATELVDFIACTERRSARSPADPAAES